jgi:regulator of sigma E protease
VRGGTPAASAGFEPGDVIVRVDNRRVREWSAVVRYINMRPDVPIDFSVKRDGELVQLTATPARVTEYSEVARDSVQFGQIGVLPGGTGAILTPGWGLSTVLGWEATGEWIDTIFDFLGRFLTGRSSSRELGGPIAIGQLSGEAARAGLWPFLTFMAIISVNLAVLNLLPIPVLDGGHLMFLFLEALRGGRPVSMKHRLRLTQIGLILVMGLMVLAFANDIMRLIRI